MIQHRQVSWYSKGTKLRPVTGTTRIVSAAFDFAPLSNGHALINKESKLAAADPLHQCVLYFLQSRQSQTVRFPLNTDSRMFRVSQPSAIRMTVVMEQWGHHCHLDSSRSSVFSAPQCASSSSSRLLVTVFLLCSHPTTYTAVTDNTWTV